MANVILRKDLEKEHHDKIMMIIMGWKRLVNYWGDWGEASMELDTGRSHSLCLANSHLVL